MLVHARSSLARFAGKRCSYSSSHTRHGVEFETDSCGIPIRPTWSVNQLLLSYPSPTISSATLKHLHSLSALVSPDEGTLEYDHLKREMEDLVKLVEAVKLVKVGEGYHDGRIWAQDTGIPLDEEKRDVTQAAGRTLLRCAAHTSNEFYVVDTKGKGGAEGRKRHWFVSIKLTNTCFDYNIL